MIIKIKYLELCEYCEYGRINTKIKELSQLRRGKERGWKRQKISVSGLCAVFCFWGYFVEQRFLQQFRRVSQEKHFPGNMQLSLTQIPQIPEIREPCSLTGHRHRRRTLKQKIMQSCRVEAMHRRRRQQRELRERQQMWGRYRVWRMISCRHTCRMTNRCWLLYRLRQPPIR